MVAGRQRGGRGEAKVSITKREGRLKGSETEGISIRVSARSCVFVCVCERWGGPSRTSQGEHKRGKKA